MLRFLTVPVLAGGLFAVGHANPAAAAASTFASAPIGAASGVTGGNPSTRVYVTNLADTGTGSLRAAAAKSGATVLFKVSGELHPAQAIPVAANVTIDGRGEKITLVDKGLTITSHNVIVRNLIIRGSAPVPAVQHDVGLTDDAVQVAGGASGVWLDHLDLSAFDDGLVDVTQGATNVTISYSKLHDHAKASLLGANVEGGTPALVNITAHHNWYVNNGERNPMMRQGNFHIFNNVIDGWGYDKDSGYGLRAGCGSKVRVENNVFAMATGGNNRATTVSPSGCDPTRPPSLKAVGNTVGSAKVIEASASSVPTFSKDASSVEAASTALASKVRAEAGWQNVALP